MIKNENYIVIQGWMINELKLKGNDLLIYAIIYGFSQAEGNKFTGSLNYLVTATNSSRATVIRTLKMLIEKGLVIKRTFDKNGVKFNEFGIPSIKMIPGEYQNDTTPGVKMIPNNICINNIDNIDIKKENNKEKEHFDFVGKSLEPVMLKWLEYRKQIKKPFKSEMAIEQCYKRLESLSGGNVDLAEKIVNQSIAGQWQGLFELKQNANGGTQNGGQLGKYAGLGRKFSNED